MILIRYINIFRGALPRFFINIKCFIADFFLLDKNYSAAAAAKKILLIRPDGIGDFIQWLPSAYAMADHYIKLNYKITLLANSAWLDYAKSFNIFDGYAELNRKKFTSDIEYKKFLISNLNKQGFDKIIYLSASREFAVGDSLIRLLKSKEKIGFKGDNSNDAWLWLAIGNKWYSKLIDINKEKKYEPYLNTVLLRNLNIPSPKDNVPAINAVDKNNFINGDYFILIPGSNMNLKQWDFKNFLSIAGKITNQTDLICVFCGGEKESELIKKNESLVNFKYENYINKTSLQELTALISKAKFILSNDTGAVHIAAGLNTPSYCVYGGGHFGRFLPYQEDKSVPRILPTVIYNKMECFNCNWKCKYQITKNNPAKCVESVSVEQVWSEIEKGIKNNFKNLLSN